MICAGWLLSSLLLFKIHHKRGREGMRYLTEEWDQNQYTAGFHEKVEAHEERGGRMTS